LDLDDSSNTNRDLATKKESNQGEESECSLSIEQEQETTLRQESAQSKALKQAERDFVIPPLNGAQECAAVQFLDPEGSSLKLVQAPPGTGKTTLVTTIICRYLLDNTRKRVYPPLMEELDEDDDNTEPDSKFYPWLRDNNNEIKRPRILVCAVSNKAVTVLASSYLRAAQGSTLFHAVMVGDEGKLLVDGQPGLRSIYVFTWMDAVIEEFQAIHWLLQDDAKEKEELLLRARALATKLHAQVPDVCSREKVTPLLNAVVESLEEFGACKVSGGDLELAKTHAEKCINKLIQKLRRIRKEQVAKELVSTANVIFSTLTSTGATYVKKGITNIGSVVIDEAAAATEPQLYIPLVNMKPKRLMIIGDPNQLPATVMSKIAERYGLNKSLLERLMFECNRPFTMLNEQYRMLKEISWFPLKAFYGKNIVDGPNVKMYACFDFSCKIVSPCHSLVSPHISYYRLSYNSPATVMGGQPYAFVHVDGEEERHASGSHKNVEEAKRVVELLFELRHVASKSRADNKWSSVDRVRVITFYQAQVDLISKLLRKQGLKNVVVSTVDSSQGSESDVVIISFVRTGKRASVGFLADNRRLNVALTRAKHQLIVVGNANALAKVSGAPTIQALVEDACERGFLVGNGEETPSRSSKQG
jgi:hypothetical protein